MEDDGLDGEAGAKAEEHPPLAALAGGGVALHRRSLPHLVHDEVPTGGFAVVAVILRLCRLLQP